MKEKLRYEIVTSDRIELFTINRSVASASLSPIGLYDRLFFNQDNKPIFFFHRINVMEGYRGIGEGTLLLSRLCEIADKLTIGIFLGINSYGPLSTDALRSWYQRYGWEYLEKKMMIRWPNRRRDERK